MLVPWVRRSGRRRADDHCKKKKKGGDYRTIFHFVGRITTKVVPLPRSLSTRISLATQLLNDLPGRKETPVSSRDTAIGDLKGRIKETTNLVGCQPLPIVLDPNLDPLTRSLCRDGAPYRHLPLADLPRSRTGAGLKSWRSKIVDGNAPTEAQLVAN